MSNSIKTALIVEGGAMRSIFSAGVLDGFCKQQFNPFDFYLGVSAGAYNLVTYLSGMPQKSLEIYHNFATNKEFISYTRFLRGGHLIDLDWIENIAFSQSHIDINRIYQHGKPLYVCMTDVNTGKAVYINTNHDNIQNVIKASAALPVFYREFPMVNGRLMTDGGIANGIPVAEAIRMGARQIMVIRSRHKQYMKKDTLGHKFIRWKLKNHTELVTTMCNRINTHRESITLIRSPPEGIKIFEICPPDDFYIGLFNRNRNHLLKGYQLGMEASKSAMEQWLSII